MPRLDVRRLAAVDMYGAAGARWRRRVIVMEFIVGAVGGIAPGLWIALSSRMVGWQLFGAWLTGMGVNYLVLALHAVSLSRLGALDTELAGIDVHTELRYYSLAQLWVAIPLAVAVLALVQLGGCRACVRHSGRPFGNREGGVNGGGQGRETGEDLMTVPDVLAELRGVSRRTFYRWRELGIAPACIRLPNGSLLIRREDFRAWLDQHSEQAA